MRAVPICRSAAIKTAKPGTAQRAYLATNTCVVYIDKTITQAGITTNIWLMAFNLLPVPPMDGGRVVFSLLPHKAAYKFARLEPYGLIILLVLIVTHVIDYWLAIFGLLADVLLNLLVSPLNSLLS